MLGILRRRGVRWGWVRRRRRDGGPTCRSRTSTRRYAFGPRRRARTPRCRAERPGSVSAPGRAPEPEPLPVPRRRTSLGGAARASPPAMSLAWPPWTLSLLPALLTGQELRLAAAQPPDSALVVRRVHHAPADFPQTRRASLPVSG